MISWNFQCHGNISLSPAGSALIPSLTHSLPNFRFVIDQNYIGEPPSIEVTLTNLNDNIDKQFLTDMVSKCGTCEEVNIYYHPVSEKHLGLARIVFSKVVAAKICVEKFNKKSVMGKVSFYCPSKTLKSFLSNCAKFFLSNRFDSDIS